MKVGLTKPVLLNSGDGHAYDLPAGVIDIDHSLLGQLITVHRDAIDNRYIPMMEDAISGANPNNPRNSAIHQQMSDEEAKEAGASHMSHPVQIDYPKIVGQGETLGSGQETDNAGNIVNTNVVSTTPAAGHGEVTVKDEGKAKLPHLVTVADTQYGKHHASTAPGAKHHSSGHKSEHGQQTHHTGATQEHAGGQATTTQPSVEKKAVGK